MNEKELQIEKIQGEITGYKQLLTNTDYEAIKYAEGAISESDYASYKEMRADLRAKINELEDEIAKLNE